MAACYNRGMLGVIFLLAVATPQPSPSPLKTITHVYSSPFCDAFNENVKHGVEGVLINDSLFKQTEPVFLKAAHDMVSGGSLASGFNSMHAARPSADNADVTLDMNRLTEISGAVVKNLETIDHLLNDPSRFPKNPKSDDDKKLVQLRAQLLALAKQQNDELNVLTGTADQYMFDTLYNQDVSWGGALSSSGKAPPSAGNFQGGPLGISDPSRLMDPVLKQNDVFMNSAMGSLYRALVVQEAKEQTMEPALAATLVQASTGCRQK